MQHSIKQRMISWQSSKAQNHQTPPVAATTTTTHNDANGKATPSPTITHGNPPIVVAEIVVVLGSTLFKQKGDEGWARDSCVFQMKAEKCRD